MKGRGDVLPYCFSPQCELGLSCSAISSDVPWLFVCQGVCGVISTRGHDIDKLNSAISYSAVGCEHSEPS